MAPAYHGDPGFLHTPFNAASYIQGVFHMMRQSKIPRHVGLEIGLGWGASAFAFLLHHESRLLSLDPNKDLPAIRMLLEAFPGRFSWAQPDPKIVGAIGPVDWLYIDGGHTFPEVKYDIETYLPLLKPGGVLAFDDYDNPVCPEVREAVDAAGIPVILVLGSPTGQAYWIKP